MNEQLDVSVVICTYNRCEMLAPVIESALTQQAAGIHYEVIIVDNNSTDRTRQVIESFIARGYPNLHYVFEERQGLSYARNAGIAKARAPIIAFSDDDCQVAPDWVARLKRAFDEHPEVDWIGGRVLPRWEQEPPRWLTPDHWAPLALTNYGDEPFYSNAANPVCMYGANFSFRRGVFDLVGLFSLDLQRVKNGIGSTEDHELQLRLWRAGRQGLYLPEITVTADVQADRLEKAYHRRWHTGHGWFRALERFDEMSHSEGSVVGKPRDDVTLFGVSAFIYRDLLTECGRWLSSTLRLDEGHSLQHENRIRHLTSYIRKRSELSAAERKHSPLVETASFIKAMLRKKARIASPPPASPPESEARQTKALS